MSSTSKLAAAIKAVADVPQDLQNIWASRNLLAYRAKENREQALAIFAGSAYSGTPLDFERGNPALGLQFQACGILGLAEAANAFEIVDESELYQRAAAVLDPLVARVQNLEQVLAVERVEKAAAEAEFAAELELANKAAIENAKKSPKVLAAQAKLASLA